MRKLAVDRLHIVALCLTLVAAILMFTGVFLPNWWVLKHHMGKTKMTFSLFGEIHCTDSVCYPANSKTVPEVVTDPTGAPVPQGTPEPDVSMKQVPPSEAGSNASWLMAGRVLSIIDLVLVSVPILFQLVFLKFNYRSLQLVAISFLIGAGAVSFITGFLFIDRYAALTRRYLLDRPEGALTYTPAAAACFLISSIMCVVATVFTSFGFFPPSKNIQ